MAEPAIAKQPKKRLAVFLDGTFNAVDDNTNVWRLKSVCAAKSEDGSDQFVYYARGVNGFYDLAAVPKSAPMCGHFCCLGRSPLSLAITSCGSSRKRRL